MVSPTRDMQCHQRLEDFSMIGHPNAIQPDPNPEILWGVDLSSRAPSGLRSVVVHEVASRWFTLE